MLEEVEARNKEARKFAILIYCGRSKGSKKKSFNKSAGTSVLSIILNGEKNWNKKIFHPSQIISRNIMCQDLDY